MNIFNYACVISHLKPVFLQPLMKKEKSNIIIGRLEQVHLPDWDFYDLEAKVDTGAYTSSLHCHHVETFKKNDSDHIRFYLLDPDHEAYNDKMLEMPLLAQREVKSSNGVSELRFFVKTSIVIFGRTYSIELSLADRSAMKYPLLIGRKFLAKGHFLVDVTKSNLSHKHSEEEET